MKTKPLKCGSFFDSLYLGCTALMLTNSSPSPQCFSVEGKWFFSNLFLFLASLKVGFINNYFICVLLFVFAKEKDME